MSNTLKGKLLKVFSIGVSVGVPLGATISQFPIWVEHSAEATLSGLFLVFSLISAIPIIRWYRSRGRTPSSAMVWIALFAAFLALSKILEQVIMISFFGAIANILGSALYKWGEHYSKKEKGAP